MKMYIGILNIICLLLLSGCSSVDTVTKSASNAAAKSSLNPTTKKLCDTAISLPDVSSTITFDPERRLITRQDGETKINLQPISSINDILKNLFAKNKPLVLYVHGLGNEPKKTEEQRILEKLEEQYDVSALMFNWDSKFTWRGKPVSKARDAAQYLSDVITGIATYRGSHPESQSVPISLLVHSMGNIVLQNVVAKENPSLTKKNEALFTNILMTASDADSQDHDLWVEKLKVKGEGEGEGKIIIVINEKDGALKKSRISRLFLSKPLGNGIPDSLAKNTTYLNITERVGAAHRYFQKGKQHEQIAICKIFTSMLRSELPNLKDTDLIKNVYKERIYIPVDKQDKCDKCFIGVTNESDVDSDE